MPSLCVCLCFLQVILSRQYGSEGRFTFTSHTPGEHQICLHSNSSKFSLFAGGMLVSLSEIIENLVLRRVVLVILLRCYQVRSRP